MVYFLNDCLQAISEKSPVILLMFPTLLNFSKSTFKEYQGYKLGSVMLVKGRLLSLYNE